MWCWLAYPTFQSKQKTVTALDYRQHPDLNTAEYHDVNFVFEDVMQYQSAEPYEALWCSHVLEHQLNPNLFLRKLHSLLEENGILVITVPPLKHEIVGGMSVYGMGAYYYTIWYWLASIVVMRRC
ncbi:class I SAM-dependent methyltransferase [Paraglaciecola aquimarina]|uniref:class I SAM-dependent methyltransferase n=1 Tax=Paraglaciecola aquimarina TaxID=1235557 RepID=UPI003D1863C3